MKSILLLFILAISTYASAQVGFNNPNPDASSLLDLKANDKGLLIPRMSSAQRDAIGSPAESLLVFDTDKQGFYFRQGGNWYALNEWVKNANSNDVSLGGNASVTGTVTAGAVTSSGAVNSASVTTTTATINNLAVPGFSNNALVPYGVIVMWNGSIGTVPSGWAMCNGGNGTPDLRDRFIVGAGSGYGVGNTGGEALHTLTTNEMPSHFHTINDPGHKHSYATVVPDGRGGDGNKAGEPATGNTASSTTGISINNAGGNQAHENRPPYYALAYIMKL